MSGVTPTLAVRSRLIFLDYYRLSTSVALHSSTERLCWPPPTCRIHPSPTMNLRFVCDRFFDLPQPCLHVNSPHVCERKFPSLFPPCLCSLPGPSLTLSSSESKSYVRALTPTPVPTDFRQSFSRPGQPALPITGLTTRAFRCPLLLMTLPRTFPRPLLLTTPHVLKYSDDVVFLSHPRYSVYRLPAPLPDNSIIIATVVNMWIVLFM